MASGGTVDPDNTAVKTPLPVPDPNPDSDSSLCCLCLDSYRDPKFIGPCHHTFCASCIEDLAFQHSFGTFPCPQCRNPTTLPEDGVQALQTNFYVLPTSPRSGRAPAHDGSREVCQVHVERLKYFCVGCQKAICSDCRWNEHKDHAAKDLNTVMAPKRRELLAKKERLSAGVSKALGQMEVKRQHRRLIEDEQAEVERAITERHAEFVALADRTRDDALSSLRLVTGNILSDFDRSLQQHEQDLARLLHVQEEVQSAVDKGLISDDVLAADTKMKLGRGVDVILNKLASPSPTAPGPRPRMKKMATSKMTENMLDSLRKVKLQDAEVTVTKKFSTTCGDRDDGTRVFSLCHVDTQPPMVWVSYERYWQSYDAPVKVFREDGQLVKNKRKTGKVSSKRLAKGLCKCTRPPPPVNTQHTKWKLQAVNCGMLKRAQVAGIMSKSLTAHYRLESDPSGVARLFKIKVVSTHPFCAEDKLEFTIRVGPLRALDVDDTENVFVVLQDAQEAQPASREAQTPREALAPREASVVIRDQRKVVMYRRPGGGPVTTYTPPVTPFQPSDVCFYTLCDQQVLLVSDEANAAIHVVSVGENTLTFVRFLTLTSTLTSFQPTALNVDVEGRVWVACKGGVILTVQPKELTLNL